MKHSDYVYLCGRSWTLSSLRFTQKIHFLFIINSFVLIRSTCSMTCNFIINSFVIIRSTCSMTCNFRLRYFPFFLYPIHIYPWMYCLLPCVGFNVNSILLPFSYEYETFIFYVYDLDHLIRGCLELKLNISFFKKIFSYGRFSLLQFIWKTR